MAIRTFYTTEQRETVFRSRDLSGGGGGGPTNIVQAVFDSGGTDGWCYYTKTTVDPSPLSGDTTPPWTGTITAHTIITRT